MEFPSYVYITMHSNKYVYLSSLIINLSAQILIISKSSWCGLTVWLLRYSQKYIPIENFLLTWYIFLNLRVRKTGKNSPLYLGRKRSVKYYRYVFLLWKNRCSQVILSIALWTELPRIKAAPVLRILQSWIDLWLIRTSVIVERSDVVGLGHNYLKLSLVSLIGIHRSPLCVTCHPCDYQVE